MIRTPTYLKGWVVMLRKFTCLALSMLFLVFPVAASAAEGDGMYQEDKLTLVGAAQVLPSSDGSNGQVVWLQAGASVQFTAENSGNTLTLRINGAGTTPTAEIWVNGNKVTDTIIETATYATQKIDVDIKVGNTVELRNFTGTSYLDYITISDENIYEEHNLSLIGSAAVLTSPDGTNGKVISLTDGSGVAFTAKNSGNTLTLRINGAGTTPTAEVWINNSKVTDTAITTTTYTTHEINVDIKVGDTVELKNFTGTSYLDYITLTQASPETGVYQETDCTYEGVTVFKDGNGLGMDAVGDFTKAGSYISFTSKTEGNTLEITQYGYGTAKLYINDRKVKTFPLTSATPYPVIKLDVEIHKDDVVKLADLAGVDNTAGFVYIDRFKVYTEEKSAPLYYQAEDSHFVGQSHNDDHTVGDFAAAEGVEKSIWFTSLNNGNALEIVSDAGVNVADLYVNGTFAKTVEVGIGHMRGRVVIPLDIQPGDVIKLTNFKGYAYIDWFGVINEIAPMVEAYGILQDGQELPQGQMPTGVFTAYADVYFGGATLIVAQYHPDGRLLKAETAGKTGDESRISLPTTVEADAAKITLMLWSDMAEAKPIAGAKPYTQVE